jgi:TolB-like protein/Tfp pilus assembly protein PilF
MSPESKAAFLSYASEDADTAARIAHALKAAGVETWFDRGELRGGEDWDRKIRRRIRDCTLFIPIISRSATMRTEGYFRLEWRLADQRTHLMAKGRVFLVPVCVDDTTAADADLPDSFFAVQWTHLRGGDVTSAFTRRVSQLLEGNRPPGEAADAGERHIEPSDPGASSSLPDKSIAVLPFTNLSEEKDGDYFSDGLAEEILNALSQVEELSVASRTSSFAFRGRSANVAEIAQQLRVAHVLEGSVRRAGKRLRITVQLVDARNGFQLWSERYDRELADVFEIQDQIARSIAERLRVTLAGTGRRRTSNLQTYELYLRGLHYWHERSPATLRMAIQCFEQSIALDPDYAPAYASLSNCYAILSFYGWLPDSIAQPKALAAMTKAMTLGASLWECVLSKALYVLYFEQEWRQAEPFLREALAMNPGSSLTCVYFGWFLTLAGREQEAIDIFERARMLDPLAPLIRGIAAGSLCMLRRFDDAERSAREALELQSDYIQALWWLGIAQLGQQNYKDAAHWLERVVALSRAPLFVGILGLGYGLAGRLEEARQLLGELDDRGSRGEHILTCATIAIHLGLRDLPAVRAGLGIVQNRPAQQSIVRTALGPFLAGLRADPDIDRAYVQLFGCLPTATLASEPACGR